jgi:hypothetical protein
MRDGAEQCVCLTQPILSRLCRLLPVPTVGKTPFVPMLVKLALCTASTGRRVGSDGRAVCCVTVLLVHWIVLLFSLDALISVE